MPDPASAPTSAPEGLRDESETELTPDPPPQNAYDDPDFFAGYSQLERFGSGWTKAFEYPSFMALIPDVSHREVPGRPEFIGPDHYHPSDERYARWAELMWAGIEPRIMRPPKR